MLYRFGPNRRRKGFIVLTPGAIVVVLLWLGASWLLSFYLANFGAYNRIYGSIGAVIALLLWLYVSAWLVMAGAALNVVVEKLGRRRQAANRARRAAAALPEGAGESSTVPDPRM